MSSQPIAPEAETGVKRLFNELETKVREFRPKDDLTPLQRADEFANQHHDHLLIGYRADLDDSTDE